MVKRKLPTPESIAIGRRITTIRKSKGLTQEELARLLNVTPSLIGQYEKGKAGLTANRIYQLIKILEVDMAFILTGNEPAEEVKAHTEIEKNLLKLVRDISPDKQDLFFTNIKNLADTFNKLTSK